MRQRSSWQMSILVSLIAVQLSFAQHTTPPKSGGELVSTQPNVVDGNALKVLLLKSWGTTTGWEDLKTEWPSFGQVPITIDDSTYISSDFTYQDLVNSGADVIVLSNPAGGEKQYSQDEISAVSQYAAAGHTVVGTYAVFQWLTTDNRGLAPVFGFLSTPQFNAEISISNLFEADNAPRCLLTGIPAPWQSMGYPFTQLETFPGKWTHKALNLAFAAADSDSRLGIVSTYDAGTYVGIFISNFPEYNGGNDDLQLLYNAVTCYRFK